jgi:hypothetical protein
MIGVQIWAAVYRYVAGFGSVAHAEDVDRSAVVADVGPSGLRHR